MRRWLLLAVVSMASMAQAQSWLRTRADSTSQTPLCVTWAKRTFVYRVDSAGSERTPGDTEFTAIDSAFSTWQAVADRCNDFVFTRGARIVGGTVGKGTESDNVVIFREQNCREVVDGTDPCVSEGSCANTYRCWDHSQGTIGLTTVTYSTRTGVAVDADIELNGAGFLMTTISSPPCEVGREAVTCVAYDVQNTVTHEIGHAVGFDHVADPGSTMAPTAPIGETSKRVLDVGTAEGFCQTYPRGQPPTPCDQLAEQQSRIVAENTGTFGISCVNSSLLGSPIAVLALLMLKGRKQKFN